MAITNGSKITKSAKSKGSTKPELSATAIAKIETELSTSTDSAADNKTEKKSPQGIIIDGKTYTCATCRSGHRVRVCKHARERPMKATHPPGRPAAGTTKKVVCECPKSCTCTSKSCKCPRQCNCVQTMYMLVYIAGPEESVDQAAIDDEKGTWKIGRAVTTDLKGNILTEEEVQLRRQQKENQKDGQTTFGSDSAPQDNSNTDSPINGGRSRSSSTHFPKSPSEAQPKASGGCCNHKKAREEKMKIAAELSARLDNTNPALHARCNCGTACLCAFCPEHSNNATSHNVIRQQFNNIYSQHNNFPINNTSIPFNTDIAPGMSCMGGQPRFTLSRYPAQLDLTDFNQAFPTGGANGAYMIAYPMHRRYAPMTPTLDLSSNQVLPDQIDVNALHEPEQFSSLTMPLSAFDATNFPDYEIGEAFVASNGPNGWQQSEWPNQGLVTPDPFTDFSGNPPFALPDETAFDDLVSSSHWDDTSLDHNAVNFPSLGGPSDLNGHITPLPN